MLKNIKFTIILFTLVFTKSLYASCLPSQVEKINHYLSSFSNLKANFTQVAHNGKQNTGVFLMKRPHLMKLTYKQPHIEILYKKGQLSFYDHEMESSQKQKIHNFILRAILDGKIQNRSLVCQSIKEYEDKIEVYSKAKYDVVNSSDMVIIFSKEYDNELSLHSIENHQKGDEVKIIFTNLEYDHIDNEIFEINK